MEGEEVRENGWDGEFSRGLEHLPEFHSLHGIDITPKAKERLRGGGWKRQDAKGTERRIPSHQRGHDWFDAPEKGRSEV